LCVGSNEAGCSASDTLHDCASTEIPRCTWEVNIQWVLKKLAGGAWAGLIWLRIGTSGSLLWTWLWTFGFYKIQGISWLSWGTTSFLRKTLLLGGS
jgi:hypothetical protein